jgi:hypothetical protein
MSSHECPKCKSLCIDTEVGYISGCAHYPPNIDPIKLNDVQKAIIEQARGRGWYIEIPKDPNEKNKF